MASNKAASPAARTQRDTRLPLLAAPRLVPAAGYRGSLRSVLVGPSVTPRIMRSPAILVFDSGVGGLTVLREVALVRPDARLTYVADDALFPYGAVPEDVLIARLAALAEAALSGRGVDDQDIRDEIAPCFVQDGSERTDTIVLACTHYPLLLDRFERLAPWPVRWIDPAPAIARRVVELLGPKTEAPAPATARALFTSGRKPSGELVAALANFGL